MRKIGIISMVLAIMGMMVSPVFAGAKLQINDEASIDLGFRLQTQAYMTDMDSDVDGKYESVMGFKNRRARIRLKGVVNDWISIFLQSENSTGDMKLIDAFATMKFDQWAQLYMGENMAAGSQRQNLTSSGALLTIDRPGIAYKNLTWTMATKAGFTNTTVQSGPAGTGTDNVRDLGATLFGSGELDEDMHLKYYFGVYNGVSGQADADDSFRIGGRVQLNLLDPEPGYYNLSTYVGAKETIGIGVYFDMQGDAFNNGTTKGDYSSYGLDLFTEYPIGDNMLTAELGYVTLDLDDLATAGGVNYKAIQGDGIYLQAGYLMGQWQPWFGYEMWGSDATTTASGTAGEYDLFRLGVTYFIEGHNANIKAGYEVYNSDAKLNGGTEDSIGTFLVGVYVTY